MAFSGAAAPSLDHFRYQRHADTETSQDSPQANHRSEVYSLPDKKLIFLYHVDYFFEVCNKTNVIIGTRCIAFCLHGHFERKTDPLCCARDKPRPRHIHPRGVTLRQPRLGAIGNHNSTPVTPLTFGAAAAAAVASRNPTLARRDNSRLPAEMQLFPILSPSLSVVVVEVVEVVVVGADVVLCAWPPPCVWPSGEEHASRTDESRAGRPTIALSAACSSSAAAVGVRASQPPPPTQP